MYARKIYFYLIYYSEQDKSAISIHKEGVVVHIATKYVAKSIKQPYWLARVLQKHIHVPVSHFESNLMGKVPGVCCVILETE